jgi:hypothetical protein
MLRPDMSHIERLLTAACCAWLPRFEPGNDCNTLAHSVQDGDRKFGICELLPLLPRITPLCVLEVFNPTTGRQQLLAART